MYERNKLCAFNTCIHYTASLKLSQSPNYYTFYTVLLMAQV